MNVTVEYPEAEDMLVAVLVLRGLTGGGSVPMMTMAQVQHNAANTAAYLECTPTFLTESGNGVIATYRFSIARDGTVTGRRTRAVLQTV